MKGLCPFIETRSLISLVSFIRMSSRFPLISRILIASWSHRPCGCLGPKHMPFNSVGELKRSERGTDRFVLSRVVGIDIFVCAQLTNQIERPDPFERFKSRKFQRAMAIQLISVFPSTKAFQTGAISNAKHGCWTTRHKLASVLVSGQVWSVFAFCPWKLLMCITISLFLWTDVYTHRVRYFV